MESSSNDNFWGRVASFFRYIFRNWFNHPRMAEVARHNLEFWEIKITNDPDLLAEDIYGKKIKIGDMTKTIYKSFCNIQVNRICTALGYEGFDGLTANEIYDKCKSSWLKVIEQEAFDAASIGDLVIAAWKNPSGHGHVCVVYPKGPMIFSHHWKINCPWVASVDRVVPCGANYAFHEKPNYFRLNKVLA